MKTALHAQLNQQIGMTPQLLQSIRLLHLNAMEVELEVARALDDNPLLERVDAEADTDNDDVAAEDTRAETEELAPVDTAEIEDFDDFIPGDVPCSGLRADDDFDPFENIGTTNTGGIRGRLREQLELELTDSRDFDVACWILDQTDDMGYLEMSLDDLATRAAVQFDINAAAVEAIRQRVLRCDPCGFAATSLRECLLAQLAELPAEMPGSELAIRIIDAHLEDLARHDNAALATCLGTSRSETEAAIALIMTLDPKPGAKFAGAEERAIVPDVIVRRRGGAWHVALNAPASPRVRVDSESERLLAQAGDGSAAKRMRDLLQEARWLTRGLSMRYETLLRTARAVVERQAEFFENGEESMRPLILREIAAAIGMHESSISRITTGKYMQTPRGTFELKYFFSARLEGAQVAGVAVRAMVKRLIDTENRSAPLADDTIVALLARRGIRIARRTVAKYRDLMHIGSAKERSATSHGTRLAASY